MNLNKDIREAFNEFNESELNNIIDSLDDISLCRIMIWNIAHSSIHNLIQKFMHNLSSLCFVIQMSCVVVMILLKNKGLSSEILNLTKISLSIIVLILSFICIVSNILIIKHRENIMKNLNKINEYTELLEKLVKEKEVNNNEK